MLLDMTTGAEPTGASFAEFAALEHQFMQSVGLLSDAGAVLPRDDAEVFKLFLLWIVVDKKRALSLDSIWRAAGSVMSRTRERNLTQDRGLRAFYENLRRLHGEEGSPRTALTRRMVRALLEDVLPRRCRGDVLARTRLMLAMEIMFGMRVGEVLTGGDYHGVAANNLVILTDLETGKVSVECLIEHSKTGFKRWVNAVGVSEGDAQVRLADYVRDYWREAGFAISKRVSAGYRVEGPNYYVLRVSLLGMEEADFERLVRVLEGSSCGQARVHASATLARGRPRLRAKGYGFISVRCRSRMNDRMAVGSTAA